MSIEDIIRGIVREELDRKAVAAPKAAPKAKPEPKQEEVAAAPDSSVCLEKAQALKAKFGIDGARAVIRKFANSVKEIAEGDRAAFIAAADARLAEDDEEV